MSSSSTNEATIMDWQGGIGTMQDGIAHAWENGYEADVEFMVGKEFWDEKSQKFIPMEEPKLFKAHKLALSFRSSVFARQFRFNNCVQHNGIPIKVNDVTASAFEAMLAFLYKNELSLIDSDNFLEVYSAAKKYWLQTFVEKCNELAPKMLNWKNSVDVWRMAKLHEDKALIGHCLQFFDMNIRYVDVKNDNVAFWSLNREELRELLRRDTLQIFMESNLFYFLEYWAFKQCKNGGNDKPTGRELRDKMGNLINEIRFPLISPAKFTKHIIKTGILTAEEIATIFIHYSEDASDELKKFNPLSFSSHPRAIQVQGGLNKLVDKHAIEEEKAKTVKIIQIVNKYKAKSDGKIKQLENEKTGNEEKIKKLENEKMEIEEKFKQLEKKAKEMEETIKHLKENAPKAYNTRLRAGAKRKKGM